MTALRFDAGRHGDLVAVMRSAITALQEHLDALELEVAALRGDWDGAAQDAYVTAHAEWARDMTALHQLLVSATAATERAGETLQRAEDQAAGIWA